jgi:uncharacterized protein (UPF0333 family)
LQCTSVARDNIKLAQFGAKMKLMPLMNVVQYQITKSMKSNVKMVNQSQQIFYLVSAQTKDTLIEVFTVRDLRTD